MKNYQITVRVLSSGEEMTWTMVANSIGDVMPSINSDYLNGREVIEIALVD